MGSLREALESAVSAQEAKESEIASAPQPVEAVQAEPVVEAPAGETEQQKADRLRDEKGRFVAGEADKAAKKEQVPAPEPIPEVKRPARPSSWKKDYWQDWDKLDPRLAEYINQRESEYAKGVSTYKDSWSNAKPLIDAVAPFQDVIQKTGLQPAQWIGELGNAHRVLTQGTPEQKESVLLQIAVNNGIDMQKFAEKIFVRGQDGNIYFNQQAIQRPQPIQQPRPQQDISVAVREALNNERAAQSIAEFEREAPQKYPHYETVKPDMALLLEAGKAQDLPSAYEMSLRLHDDLWKSKQEEQRKAEEAARLEAQRKAVQAAKGSAVSVKSATPATAGAAPKKGLRAQLEEAYDQHASGRV